MTKNFLMLSRFFLFICISISLFPVSVLAQVTEVAIPFSISGNLPFKDQFVDLPKFNAAQMMQDDETERRAGNKRHRFAKLLSVSFDPYTSGSWSKTNEGRVWRLGIRSEGAYSLYLVFHKFELVAGVKLFVYTQDAYEFAGAFTSANNSENKVLTVAPLADESLIIELNVPEGISNFGSFELTQVWHDYRNEFGYSKQKAGLAGPSQTCNVDINCTEGKYWQTEKNAVVKLIAGGEMCTGTLLNNTSGKKIPYLYTAQHCIGTEQLAAGSVFYFNYERPFCGAIDGKAAKTLSGAKLIATTAKKLDFSLVRLNQFPPIAYRPYFAGWDNSPSAPQNAVCIHHPNGDVKKITIDQNPLITGNFGEGYDTNSHWKVLNWEVGSTEGGSSGSPIFNNAHLLTGSLTGGDATCVNPVNDYFTKFSLAWNGYPDSANQVKVWLDPLNLGLNTLDGIDPYGFTDAMCDTFWNTGKTETLGLIQSGLTSGYLSGHNSRKDSVFAEHFIATGSIQIPGIFMNIAKAYAANSFSYITLKIWKGLTSPSTEYYSKKFYIKLLQENVINFLEFDSLLTLSGNFYVGYQINYSTPSDIFAVYQAINRALSDPSTMFVKNENWQNINAVSNPVISSSLALGFAGCNGLDPSLKVSERKRIELNIYPNPSDDYAIASFTGDLIAKPIITNLVGKFMPVYYEEIQDGIQLKFTDFPSGVYFLCLRTRDKILTGRICINSK